ncbi:MAG: hypothetical protein ACPGXX_20820 [Planctomycetaceae bacterium]
MWVASEQVEWGTLGSTVIVENTAGKSSGSVSGPSQQNTVPRDFPQRQSEFTPLRISYSTQRPTVALRMQDHSMLAISCLLSGALLIAAVFV